jgi:hypothetical protein
VADGGEVGELAKIAVGQSGETVPNPPSACGHPPSVLLSPNGIVK